MAIKDLVSPEHTPYLVLTTGIPEEPLRLLKPIKPIIYCHPISGQDSQASEAGEFRDRLSTFPSLPTNRRLSQI